MDVNIFTQIGFVVLVGLASKNAILIVEFAKQQQEAGMPRREATLEACRLRLRPILMTSFAFILGVVPLVIAQGAGAEMRQSLGMAVFSGMLGVTLFGIFLTPVFYYVLQRSANQARRLPILEQFRPTIEPPSPVRSRPVQDVVTTHSGTGGWAEIGAYELVFRSLAAWPELPSRLLRKSNAASYHLYAKRRIRRLD